jgi:hypothetical protein
MKVVESKIKSIKVPASKQTVMLLKMEAELSEMVFDNLRQALKKYINNERNTSQH